MKNEKEFINVMDPTLPGTTMVSASEIAKAFGISPITWLDWARNGKAPAPYPLAQSPNALRWMLSDVREHLAKCRAKYLERYKLQQ